MVLPIAMAQMDRRAHYGRSNDHGGGDSGRDYNTRLRNTIDGLLAEVAVSRAFGCPWTPGGVEISKGDVDDTLEVRHTKYQNGHLLIYSGDPDEAPFILVVGSYPKFRLAGWIQGAEGKQKGEWKGSVTPCYWVSQADLRAIPTKT
jgi:hypothetical protein